MSAETAMSEHVDKLLAVIDGMHMLAHPEGGCGQGCGYCSGMIPIWAARKAAAEVRAAQSSQVAGGDK